jgi:hypothetical protein
MQRQDPVRKAPRIARAPRHVIDAALLRRGNRDPFRLKFVVSA